MLDFTEHGGGPAWIHQVRDSRGEDVAVRGITVALAKDVESCHENRGTSTRARAPGRLGRHTLRVVLPSVAVTGEGLGDAPVDFSIGRAEEWYGGSGDGKIIQELVIRS